MTEELPKLTIEEIVEMEKWLDEMKHDGEPPLPSTLRVVREAMRKERMWARLAKRLKQAGI